ncbi:MAG: hypothetical protein B0D92_07830 [Spirochaeta sp. LUC14_002_19_P3]|nr:MAG: hypothetical protein B0D92_07830 [Spirochaeta sp. LUC14_002_19_P3]
MDISTKLFTITVILTGLGFPIWSQDISLESMQSLNEWRWGVIAYNDGLPGKALLSMERAVSLNPADPKIREWLGWTYWKSGLESAALDVWERLIEEGNASAFLQSRAERLQRRISGDDELPTEDEWIPLTAFQGEDGQSFKFQHPTAARGLNDKSGSLVIVSYSGRELIHLDVNGSLIQRYEGGLGGLGQPFDMVPIGNGRVLVSEFQADRLSVLTLEGLNKGYRVETWGGPGRGDDKFFGPQYMALSPDGYYVYISDWGNKRVSKWQNNGSHILNFTVSGNFSGFQGPSGIAAFGEKVYIADSIGARIEVFDTAGNYLGPLITEGLNKPEGMTIFNGNLLVADGANIYQVDTVSGEMSQFASLGGGDHRITTVFPDENGNLAVSDFNANRVVLLTPLSTLYGGLEVTLHRVMADAFPSIFVDFSVEDRAGNPIIGLKKKNFRFFDGNSEVGNPVIDWESSSASSVSIAVAVDTAGSAAQVRALLRGLDDVMNGLKTGDELTLIETTKNPTLFEIPAGGSANDFFQRMRSAAGNKAVSWDETLRLAANQIAPERNRKAVFAFVTVPPSSTAFDTYGLVETARLLANNGIVFYPIYTDEDSVSRELDYIAAETKGESFFLNQPEGSGFALTRLRDMKAGRYTVSWKSSRDAGFGRTYLPVSLEVIYIGKSGRAESGTFAPLK